jgi:hypothetical protein
VTSRVEMRPAEIIQISEQMRQNKRTATIYTQDLP